MNSMPPALTPLCPRNGLTTLTGCGINDEKWNKNNAAQKVGLQKFGVGVVFFWEG